MLEEVLCAGWQPVSAVDADERLWTSRYGRGLGSFVAISNPTSDSVACPVAIDAPYLGTGCYVFAQFDGRPAPCRIVGATTRMDIGLSPHEARVYRAVVEISNTSVRGRGSVTYEPKPHRLGRLEAELALDRPARTRVRCLLPSSVSPREVRLNGRRASGWAHKGDVVELDARLEQTNKLVIAYTPQIAVYGEPEDLVNFPFVTAGKPACVIVANAGHELSAQRIASYFEYWHLTRKHPGGNIMRFEGSGPKIPITTQWPKAQPRTSVVFVGASGSNTIAGLTPDAGKQPGIVTRTRKDGRDVIIAAGADHLLTDKAVLRLLDLLDSRYEFCGAVIDRPIFRKAGLTGKPLD